MRENEISLRNSSGGTTHLHTLEGTLLGIILDNKFSWKLSVNTF